MNDYIPTPLKAICCYYCKWYFIDGYERNDIVHKCTKFDFEMTLLEIGFTALFNRCEHFEEK